MCDEAKEIFDSLMNERPDKFKKIMDDLKMKTEDEVVALVNDVFQVLNDPKEQASAEVCFIISVMGHFLIRYFCRCLMQVLTPEGLALRHKSIPQSFCRHYMDHQEHFSLKKLIQNHIEGTNSRYAIRILLTKLKHAIIIIIITKIGRF